MTDEQRRRNLEAVHRAYAAIAEGDADAMMANYTDDVVFEFPFSDPPARIEGRAVLTEYLRNAFTGVRFSLEITDIHETVDPDRVVIEMVSSGTILANGTPYANSYISVYWFRDGAISHVREYLNPVLYAKALAASAEAEAGAGAGS
jgi:uncharacterized protein